MTQRPARRLLDAHVHLDKYDDSDIAGVVGEIERHGILTVSVSVDRESFLRAEGIADYSPLIIPAFGIHPEQAPDYVDSLRDLADLAGRAPMIGEIGLDHRFVTDAEQYPAQRRVFECLLDIADAQRKAVNLHTAGAEQETLEMLMARGIERAIVHWYSGPLDVLEQMAGAGWMFTVGVEVLSSAHVKAVANAIPAGQLLTETDNPGGLAWLTGATGRPSELLGVVDEIARIRGITVNGLVTQVGANMARLMQGDPHLERWLPLVA